MYLTIKSLYNICCGFAMSKPNHCMWLTLTDNCEHRGINITSVRKILKGSQLERVYPFTGLDYWTHSNNLFNH